VSAALHSSLTAPPAALIGLLDEMAAMLARLSDDEYVAPAPGRRSGSIGAHVRHCLDHVASVLDAGATGRCCYDRRVRGTAIEQRRHDAAGRIAELSARLSTLDASKLHQPLDVEVQLDARGSTAVVRSTLARELAFVISHTIHHNATVALMLLMRGVTPPRRLGMAYSTPESAERRACAP